MSSCCLMSVRRWLFLCCTRVVRKIIINWSQLKSRTCWSTVLWRSCNEQIFIFRMLNSNFILKQERHRDCCCKLFVCMYVCMYVSQKEKFPATLCKRAVAAGWRFVSLWINLLQWTLSGCDAETKVTVHVRLGVAWRVPGHSTVGTQYSTISCVYRMSTYVRDPDLTGVLTF